MKIAIIHSVAGLSAKSLAIELRRNGMEAEIFRLKDTAKRDFRDFDHVFAYGTSEHTRHKHRINSAEAVCTCIDKPSTFHAFNKANVSTVEYCVKKPIPKHWDWVVVRDKKNGRKAEGLNYFENGPDIPDGALYSEYFEHEYEYRIMVFMGKIIGRYFKAEKDGDWYFNIQPKQGFELMDAQCIKAAASIGIDYVGFDVVAVNKNDFKILEANSAPRITDEAEYAIVEYFLNL